MDLFYYIIHHANIHIFMKSINFIKRIKKQSKRKRNFSHKGKTQKVIDGARHQILRWNFQTYFK